MNSIKEKKRKIQNLSNTRTIKRINQISRSFSAAGPDQRGKMLGMLAGEIGRTKTQQSELARQIRRYFRQIEGKCIKTIQTAKEIMSI